MKAKMIAIIFLLSIAVFGQDCQNPLRAINYVGRKPTPLQKLQTGHFSIENIGLPNRYRTFRKTYAENHDKLRIGVSLTISFIEGYLDRSGLDFSVRPIVKDTYFDAFFTMSTRARWVTAHINYIVSSRQDLIAGFIVANDQGLLQPSSNPRTFCFKNQTIGLANSELRGFAYATISGIKIQQLQVEMKLTSYYFNTTTNEVTIYLKVYKNLKPIQLLYFSFMAYTLGDFVINDAPGRQFDYIIKVFIKKIDQTYTRSIIAMAGINGTQIQKLFDLNIAAAANKPKTIAGAAQKRLLTEMPLTQQNILPLYGNRTFAQLLSDPNLANIGLFDSILSGRGQYPGTTKPQVELYQSSFVIAEMGNIVNIFDSPAPTSSFQDLLKQDIKNQPNSCVSQSDCFSIGGKSIPVNNGKFICQLCKINGQFYDIDGKKCQCAQGLIFKDQKQCVSPDKYCAKDEEYKNGLCYKDGTLSKTCDQSRGYIANDQKTQCICKPTLFEKADQKGDLYCVKDCQLPQVYNFLSKDCRCPGNALFFNGKCTECPLNSIWDPILKKCKCKTNFSESSKGQCAPCSIKAIFNHVRDKCQCKSGYIGNGFICMEDTNSKSGTRIISVQRVPL